MRRLSVSSLALAIGFSLYGCSDEKAGPGVGPDFSWQAFCIKAGQGGCATAEDPHGPLDGLDEETNDDNYKFKVSCEKLASGISITIEDPGRDEDIGKKLRERARAVLKIQRVKPSNETCFVELTEYSLSGGRKVLQDTCAGTDGKDGEPGSCVLEGDEDKNGYAFEGTLTCDAMKSMGQGEAGWKLRKATKQGDPIDLQIANCK